MGNKGWAYQDVLQYFKKLETMDIPEMKSDNDYHGTNGPVHITSPSFHTPLAEAFLEAGKELGYSLVDYNEKNKIGFSYQQTTIMNGTRMSIAIERTCIPCTVVYLTSAIRSPQLLMVSGIGPAIHLTDLGINVIQDAPVGENLMDRYKCKRNAESQKRINYIKVKSETLMRVLE
ncbi:Glucose dehydrogenase [Temnothorax longispinosus]|uniref:Glucose dehydrogenase n=1 Tax=Temnothorax longispinosus TaxID=300112 RepID=A0A4S2K9A7_9HYME|nr:Glucose dehydrogenase [Temnothorax longispinosus]